MEFMLILFRSAYIVICMHRRIQHFLNLTVDSDHPYDFSIQITGRVDPAQERIWLFRLNAKYNTPMDYCSIDQDFYVYGDAGCAVDFPGFTCLLLQLTSVRSQ